MSYNTIQILKRILQIVKDKKEDDIVEVDVGLLLSIYEAMFQNFGELEMHEDT